MYTKSCYVPCNIHQNKLKFTDNPSSNDDYQNYKYLYQIFTNEILVDVKFSTRETNYDIVCLHADKTCTDSFKFGLFRLNILVR